MRRVYGAIVSTTKQKQTLDPGCHKHTDTVHSPVYMDVLLTLRHRYVHIEYLIGLDRATFEMSKTFTKFSP